MTAEPGPTTAALYSLQSNKKICEALPVLQTDNLSSEQHLLTTICLFKKKKKKERKKSK